MADKREKGKGKGKWKGKAGDNESGFNDFAIVVAVFIVFIVIPLFPLFVLFGKNTTATFFELWHGSVRPIVMILDALLIGFMAFTILEIWQIQPHVRLSRTGKPKEDHAKKHAPMFSDQWAKVRAKMAGNTPDHSRLAIIEADALTDEFLRYVGYEGEHMADRLSKLSSAHIKSLNAVWNAHRLRNSLVHTPSVSVSLGEAQRALSAYEEFLKEMGGIE